MKALDLTLYLLNFQPSIHHIRSIIIADYANSVFRISSETNDSKNLKMVIVTSRDYIFYFSQWYATVLLIFAPNF